MAITFRGKVIVFGTLAVLLGGLFTALYLTQYKTFRENRAASVSPHFSCIVTDPNVTPNTSVTKPDYLESYIDPVFKTKITRITDDAGRAIVTASGTNLGTWQSGCSHHYQKDQPWNADGTLLWLWKNCGGGLILDGNTYKPLFKTSAGGADRWHPTDPNLMIRVSGNEAYYWNVHTGARVTTRSFSGYSGFQFGPSEGNPSNDGKWVAPLATRSSDGHTVTFAINIETGQKGPDIDLNHVSYIDWVSISASGKYIVVVGCVHGTDTGGASTCNDRKQIFDALTGQTKGGGIWEEYGFPSHFDIAIDPTDGEDVAVGISKTGGGGVGTIKRRLSDGEWTNLGPEGSHTSTRNILRPGWAYITHPGGNYRNEVIAVSFDGSIVERLGYIPNNDSSYLGEGHAAVSPDGRKVVIRANWNSGALFDYVTEVTCGAGATSPPTTPPTNPPTGSPTPAGSGNVNLKIKFQGVGG